MAPIDPSTDPSKEAFKHGMALDPENKRVQCCYCGKVVTGFNRLQHHLGGIRGNITECPDVPPEIKEFFKESLLSAKVGRLVKEVGDLSHPGPPLKRTCTSNPKPNGVNPDKVPIIRSGQSSSSRVKKTSLGCSIASSNSLTEERSSNRNLSHSSRGVASCSSKQGQDSTSGMAKRRIGKFFFENGVDFSAIKSPSFLGMLEISMKLGEAKRSIPSIEELKGWILEDELKEIRNYIREVRLSWARTGCSILLDGWTDHLGRDLMNIIIDCPMGPTYLRSADVSPSTEGTNGLKELLESVLEEVGVQNVIQIVAHTTSDTMEVVSKHLIEKYRTLFWTVSATHCISMILERISLVDIIEQTLENARTITKFIYSRAEVLKLLRRHISSRDLVKSSKIKIAGCFLTLENFVVEKRNLDLMFTSSEWLNSIWASSVEGQLVAYLIKDSSFWGGVVTSVKASIPLVRAMSLINRDGGPHTGFIYETMDQVKETISEEFGGRKSLYMQYWQIIDDVWNTILHSPLHAAGYFLNPRLYYAEDFFSDTEVAGGLLITVVRMVEDKRTQELISQQIDLYGSCRDDFKTGTQNDIQYSLSPVEWWSRFGGHCPDLQKIAIKILSQTCIAAEFYGLKRDLAEKLISCRRNLIEQQILHNLAYVHYNLQLKKFKVGPKPDITCDEIDPTDDWIIDETYHAEVAKPECGDHHNASMDADCVSTIEEEGASSVEPKIEPKTET